MKTSAMEVLRELVTAIQGMRRETIGGILPEVSSKVTDDAKVRLKEAIREAAEFLHIQRTVETEKQASWPTGF